MLAENCTVAAAIDGSWKGLTHHGKGRIGGILKSGLDDHILEFDGPVRFTSTLQAEKMALNQLVNLILNSQWCSEKIVILTDSMQLVDLVNSQGLFSEWEDLQLRISIRHVNRDFNVQADRLAKQGG